MDRVFAAVGAELLELETARLLHRLGGFVVPRLALATHQTHLNALPRLGHRSP